jgi:hypothetical protein
MPSSSEAAFCHAIVSGRGICIVEHTRTVRSTRHCEDVELDVTDPTLDGTTPVPYQDYRILVRRHDDLREVDLTDHLRRWAVTDKKITLEVSHRFLTRELGVFGFDFFKDRLVVRSHGVLMDQVYASVWYCREARLTDSWRFEANRVLDGGIVGREAGPS